MFSKILKDPLLHFLIIGGVIFQLYQWRQNGQDDALVVSADTVKLLQQQYEKTWLRKPTQEQLTVLINNYVLDELYAKQAFELGMHKGDQVVNRRMKVKLELLNSLLVEPPTADEVSIYYQNNKERYKQSVKFAFEQRYFDQQKNITDIADVLRQLNQGQDVVSDASMLAKNYIDVTQRQIQRDFGGEFAEWVVGLPQDTWQGPFRSPLGWHFAKLTVVGEALLIPLNDIYDLVEADTKEDKLQKVRAAFEKQLLDAQPINIDWPKDKNNET